ncbi:MAG: hypothetical protein RML46_08080 [Anaerolineae bacterium]|nr:hypothetical protein [Anaerolineae bacterium]MDW8068855.1 hypothetical protein [Anaerolineae bacterium]
MARSQAWLAGMPLLFIGVSVPLVALAFLWPAPTEFPMDDAYIHFVYARNLAEYGQWMFNFPTEKGVGTSSPLWVLLLTGGYLAGIPLHLTAKAMGIGSLIATGAALYRLLHPLWGPIIALGATLAVVLSGPMVWFSLSGMETTLFLALALLVLLAYRAGHFRWMGLLLGLLTLTRPEGLALALTIALAETIRHRRIPSHLIGTGLLCGLIAGPWFLYLYLRTGYILPTSGLSKHITATLGIRLVAERNPVLGILARLTPLTYLGLWGVYLAEFVLGGMVLPPPRLPIGTIVGNPHYTLSVWAIVGWIGMVGPLLWTARRAWDVRCWPSSLQDPARRPWVAFLLWLAIHNLCYMAFLPVPGTASRYGAINHIALWLGLASGLRCFSHRPTLQRVWLVGWLLLLVANGHFWNAVYDANLEHMQNVRIAAARFVRDQVPPEELCAAFDIGVVRFYGERPILDLYGLVDPEVAEWYARGEMDRYLRVKNVRCLILPDRPDTTEDGWFELGTMLGLLNSPLLAASQIALFEIGQDRWLKGYLPTLNYQAAVTVYRLFPVQLRR